MAEAEPQTRQDSDEYRAPPAHPRRAIVWFERTACTRKQAEDPARKAPGRSRNEKVVSSILTGGSERPGQKKSLTWPSAFRLGAATSLPLFS
jgi:hypothetical protein